MSLPLFPTLQPDKNIPDFPHNAENFIYESKYDGFRGLLYFSAEENKVWFLSRRKIKIEVANNYKIKLLEQLSPLCQNCILDGELIAVNKEHLSGDYEAFINRLNTPTLIQYRCFDILWFNSVDLRNHKLLDRKKILEAKFNLRSLEFRLSPWANSVEELVAKGISVDNLEGFVAKQISSRYEGGRQRTWIKMKPREVETVLVTGWTGGTGKWADTMGSLKVATYTEDPKTGKMVLKPAGEVGTGWNDEERHHLWEMIQNIEKVTPSPIYYFPIEVIYDHKTAEHQLYHASFERVTSLDNN